MRLRVLAINVWNTKGDPRRLDLLNSELRRLDPDLVAFEEVIQTPERNQLEELLAGTDLHGTHQVQVMASSPPWVDIYGGSAVATRWPHRVAEALDLRLPDAQDVPWATLAVRYVSWIMSCANARGAAPRAWVACVGALSSSPSGPSPRDVADPSLIVGVPPVGVLTLMGVHPGRRRSWPAAWRWGRARAVLVQPGAARFSAYFSLTGSPVSSSSKIFAKIAKLVSIWLGESLSSSQ
jgi:hypothetical protein